MDGTRGDNTEREIIARRREHCLSMAENLPLTGVAQNRSESIRRDSAVMKDTESQYTRALCRPHPPPPFSPDTRNRRRIKKEGIIF
ncbi:hypothetical protein MXM51_21560 [Pantoea stewartii]|uniref:hypothetical protein n=1 Tax=Pantoea stewartii TaxID=66269 RepID=UPI002DC015C7|nr:hypothetical protein [Pantoea stewartii]MEB6537100.1 hypothetical protein [Pantoea stewartii]